MLWLSSCRTGDKHGPKQYAGWTVSKKERMLSRRDILKA